MSFTSLFIRSFTTAAVCPAPSHQATVRLWGWASVPMPRTAAAVSPPTWLYLSSAPLSTLWESHLVTWSSYGLCIHEEEYPSYDLTSLMHIRLTDKGERTLFYRLICVSNLVLCNYRCISPELKPLALGIQTLATRTLGESCHWQCRFLLLFCSLICLIWLCFAFHWLYCIW